MSDIDINAARALRNAAARIERDGWKQDDLPEPPYGPCCMMRALIEAAPFTPVLDTAERALKKYIGWTGPYVAEWNDEPGRTVDEVLAALRGAAAEVSP